MTMMKISQRKYAAPCIIGTPGADLEVSKQMRKATVRRVRARKKAIAAIRKRTGEGVCALHGEPQPVNSCECSSSWKCPPCANCGDRCMSQHEHVNSNFGRPWLTCSGCAEKKDGGW